MIYYFTPYLKGNLGKAYNHYCSLVPNDDDWITMIDGDIMHLHMNWGDLWSKILELNNDAGIVTCLTNRIGCPLQLASENDFDVKNILKHRKIALNLFEKNKFNTKKIPKDSDYYKSCMSGFFFSFKKSTWKLVNGFIDGVLHVDTNFFNKVIKQKDCVVAQGFYVFHYYRMAEGRFYKDHLK